MLAFLAIAVSIFGLVNFYVGRRGAQALAAYPAARAVFLVLFIALALAYPLARILRAFASGLDVSWLMKIGSCHLVVMLYGFLAVLIIDLVRLVNAFLPFLPKALTTSSGRTGLVLFLIVTGTTALTIGAGAWNALRLRTVDLDIHLPRRAGTVDRLTAVVASDLHLGTLVGRSRLEKVVERINALEPDIVFFPGDIVDETVTAKDEAEFSAIMKKLRPPLGLFAVPGNHEFYSGLQRTLACLRACGITVLEDQAVRVAGAFTLVGRRDRSSLTPGEKRMPIADILAREGLDDSLPFILLDHQPAHLEEAEQAGVSLQLSGHTHAGQIFPLDIVNRMVWELNWGSLRKGQTQYYVTSGVGTWGPPVRTGSRPEIVRVELTFDRTP
jgi:hypothetical protein